MYEELAKLFLIAYDKFAGRQVYQQMKYLEKTQWMKRRHLQKLQLDRMKRLLWHAYRNVPYYHRSFEAVDFHPSHFKSFEAISKLPVLEKSAVRRSLDEFTARNFPRKELIRRQTSGTTAVPMTFYRNKKDVSWGIAAELRGYGWAGYKVGDKVAIVGVFPRHTFRSFKFQLGNLMNRNKILLVNKLSEKSMDSFTKKMRLFKPQFIRGNSGQINILATFMLHDCLSEMNLQAVFTTGETLFDHYQKTIQEAFDCEIYDYYATSEVSQAAMQCGHHEGMHVIDENIFLEVVKDGESASPGEKGRVLLTNLHSFAMPLIRYDVGDIGSIFEGGCACGRELSLFKPVGKTIEYFVNSDGSFTFLRDFQILLKDLPIKDFQVVQDTLDEIDIRIVTKPGFKKEHSDFISKNAKLLGLANIQVEIVDLIPSTRSGKVIHKVSKISTKYT